MNAEQTAMRRKGDGNEPKMDDAPYDRFLVNRGWAVHMER